MKIGNIFLKPTLALLAVMPIWMLHGLSFAGYFFIYYVFRYRRRVVYKNLRTSFPEKSRREIRTIAREFYLNFVEYFFETAKLPRISKREIGRRMVFENVELIRDYLRQGRPVVGYYAHTGNWEWVTYLGEKFVDMPNVHPGEVYRPLKNKWFDTYMVKIRTTFNSHCYPKSMVFRDLVREIRDGKLPFCVFMSDQKPSHGDKGYITEFLNQPTAIISGTETVARKLNAPAVFLDMTKLSRGYYHVRIVPMTDNVADTPDGFVTDLYAKMLENNIRRQPSIWLWSHNRWKNPVELTQTNG